MYPVKMKAFMLLSKYLYPRLRRGGHAEIPGNLTPRELPMPNPALGKKLPAGKLTFSMTRDPGAFLFLIYYYVPWRLPRNSNGLEVDVANWLTWLSTGILSRFIVSCSPESNLYESCTIPKISGLRESSWAIHQVVGRVRHS